MNLKNLNVGLWLGLFREAFSAEFVWSDHSLSLYTAWAPKQPNAPKGQKTCVVVNSSNSNAGLWDDVDCAARNGFICRIRRGTLDHNSACSPCQRCVYFARLILSPILGKQAIFQIANNVKDTNNNNVNSQKSITNSTWLITSELTNQSAPRAAFTCVIYTNELYLTRENLQQSVLPDAQPPARFN